MKLSIKVIKGQPYIYDASGKVVAVVSKFAKCGGMEIARAMAKGAELVNEHSVAGIKHAVDAARGLDWAYHNGEENGGSVDWEDVNEAWESAVKFTKATRRQAATLKKRERARLDGVVASVVNVAKAMVNSCEP